LASISDEIVQAHYIGKVARKLGVPRDAVADQTRKIKTATTASVPKIEIPTKPKIQPRRELLEERLLALAFQSDPKIISKKEIFSLFSAPLTTRIAEEYKKHFEGKKGFDPSDFAASLPKELVQGFADMILEDVQNLIEKPQILKKEQTLVIRELGFLKIKDELVILGEKIREYEEKDEKGKLRKVEEKFGKLSEKLTRLEENESKSIIL
jgi:hypothetical protein